MAKGDTFHIGPHEFVEAYRKECSGRTCTALIAMAKDSIDHWHPFDVEGDNAGHSHYATCPDAKKFRERKNE